MDTTISLSIIQLLAAVVGMLATIGGVLYAFFKRWVRFASEGYVEEQVKAETDPISDRIDDAIEKMEENQDDISELRSLIEGGNSKFEKGMIDFLNEEIERTNSIQDDIEEVRDMVYEMKERDDGG